LAAGGALLAFWALHSSLAEAARLRLRHAIGSALEARRARLEEAVSRRLALLDASAAHVAGALESGGQLDDLQFQRFARRMAADIDGLLSLQLAPGNVVASVYPLEPNKSKIGEDLMARPGARPVLEEMIRQNRRSTGGPWRLRTGEWALIAAIPIYWSDPAAQGAQRYWGLANIVLDFEAILREVGLPSAAEAQYALRAASEDQTAGTMTIAPGGEAPFFGSPRLFDPGAGAEIGVIELPNARWAMAAAPVSGWDAPLSGPEFWRLRWGGVLTALAVGLLTWRIGRDSLQLQGEIKRATADLRESRERYRQLFEGTPAIKLLLDPATGSIVEANPAAGRFYGLEAWELRGRSISDFSESVGSASEAILEIARAASGGPAIFESRHAIANGEKRPVEIQCAPLDVAGRRLVYAIVLDIAERKRAERELRASEERYRQMFEGTSAAKLLVDPEHGAIVDANEAACSFYGYDRETLRRREISDFDAAADSSSPREIARAGRSSNVRFETRHRLASGQKRDVEIYCGPIQTGDRLLVHAIVHDISDRKRAERNLRRTAAELEAVFLALPDQFFLLDKRGKIAAFHAATPEALFAAPETMMGRALEELLPPEAAKIHRDCFERARQERAPQFCEYSLSADERAPRPFDVRCLPLRGSEGFLVVARDIAERKRAEEALASSERRYRGLFELSPAGIMLRDARGRILDVNPAWEATFGLKREQALGRDANMLFPRRLAETVQENLSRVLAGESLQTEMESVRLDGQTRLLELREAKVALEDGSDAVLTLAADVTEARRAIAELAKNERRYRAIFELSPCGIVLEDSAGRLLAANPAGREIFHFPSSGALPEARLAHLAETPSAGLDDAAIVAKVLGGETVRRVVRAKLGAAIRSLELREAPIALYEGGEGLLRIVDDITDRLERERETRQQAAIIDAMADGVAVFDANGRVVMVNPAMCRLAGRSADHLLGRSAKEAWEEIDEETTPFPEGARSDTRERVLLVKRIGGLGKQGRFVSARSFDMSSETAPLVATIYRDVTRRRQAELALRESERFARSTLDGLSALVAIVEADGSILAVNSVWKKAALANGGDLVRCCEGANYFAVCQTARANAEEAEPFAAGLRAVLQGRAESFELEYACHHPRGDRRWYLARATPFPGDGPPRAVVAHENITQRKLAEESLRLSREELREQKVLLELILASLGEGVIVADPNGKFLVFNPAAERILGLGPIDAPPQEWAQRYGVFRPEDGTPMPTEELPLARTLRGEEVNGVEIFILNATNPEGICLEVTGRPLLNRAGQSLGGVVAFRDVTGRRAAEQALRESEERFRALADSVPALIWVAGEDGRCLYVNRRWSEFSGRPSEREIGWGWMETFHPADASRARDLCQQSLEARCGFQFECRQRRGDGETRWMLARGAPLPGPDGSFRGYVGSCVDITERKRAERALRESELKLRFIIENTTDAIFIKDLEGRYALINPAGARAFNLPVSEVEGKSDADLFGSEDSAAVRAADIQVMSSRQTLVYEGERLYAGRKRIFRSQKFPYLSEMGEVLGVIGVAHDITELKEAERSLQRQLAFASVIAELGRSIDGSVDARAALERVCHATKTYCDAPEASMVYAGAAGGLTESATTISEDDERHRKRVRFLRRFGSADRVPDSAKPLAINNVETASGLAEAPLIHLYGVRAFARVPVRAEGEIIGLLYAWSLAPRVWEPGVIERMEQLAIQAGAALGNARLFERVNERNRRLQAALEQLERARRERDEFYRFLVHDLNKPLAAIKGFARRLRSGEDAPDKAQRNAERIHNAAARLSGIVEQFLRFEQIRRGDITTTPVLFDAWDQIREMARLLSGRTAGEDREILVGGLPLAESGSLSPLLVYTDAICFGRVLQNFLDNAVKYGRERVEVDARIEGDKVLTRVWNDGASIPPQERETIFMEYYRSSDAAASGIKGFGLGLASARKLAEMLGGRAWAGDPGERGGAEFWFEMPGALPEGLARRD
jgi:PAS domain S-box-containing protein